MSRHTDNKPPIAPLVYATIASMLDVDHDKVVPGARLREELGADESDVWTLALALEDELDIGFDEEEAPWLTVGNVVDCCERVCREQHA